MSEERSVVRASSLEARTGPARPSKQPGSRKRSAEPGSVAWASSLLDAAEQAGFELFITADQELSYRQNLTGRKMALMALSTNNWDFIKAAIARITAVIDAVTPGSYTEVEIPE